jgi:hypothetical protein
MKNQWKYVLGLFVLVVLCGNFVVLFSNADTGIVTPEETTAEEPSEKREPMNRGQVALTVAKGQY